MRDQVSERMGKFNVDFTKDILSIGVTQVKQEGEIDATQRYLVKALPPSSNYSQSLIAPRIVILFNIRVHKVRF